MLFSERIIGGHIRLAKGFVLKIVLAPWLPLWVRVLNRQGIKVLPDTLPCLAVTPVDVRLFAVPSLGTVYEVGRWSKSSYRAGIRDSLLAVSLDMEVERIGRIMLDTIRTAAG